MRRTDIELVKPRRGSERPFNTNIRIIPAVLVYQRKAQLEIGDEQHRALRQLLDEVNESSPWYVNRLDARKVNSESSPISEWLEDVFLDLE